MTPGSNHQLTLENMQTTKGEPLDVAPGSGWVVKIKLPESIDFDKIGQYALLVRDLTG